METMLIPNDQQEKIRAALEFCDSLRSIKIDTQEEYENANELCKKIKVEISALESDRKELVEPYKTRSNKIDATYREPRSKLENAEAVIKRGMADFFAAQERKRIEEQRKIDAHIEAKKKAAQEKADAELQKADQYRADGRENMAQAAEARADTAATTAINLTAPIVNNRAKATGTSFSKRFVAYVADEKAAKIFIAQSDLFRHLLTIDIAQIEKIANSMKMPLDIAGISFKEDFKVSVRTK